MYQLLLLKPMILNHLNSQLLKMFKGIDLNAIEEAQGYQRLIDDFYYDQYKVATIYWQKSKSYLQIV